MMMFSAGAFSMLVPVHALMFLFFLLKDLWSSQASLRWQMPDVQHNGPHLVIAEDLLPGRHAGGIDAIYQDPVQLAIGISLDILGRQIGYRRCHLLGKGNTGVLAIEPVADCAVMAEVLLALRLVGFGVRHRIVVVFAANRDLLLQL